MTDYSVEARLRGRDESASRAVRGLGRTLRTGLLSPLRAVRSAGRGVLEGFKALPGVGLALGGIRDAATGIVGYVEELATANDTIAKTARRAGVTAATLQELRHALGLSGAEAAEVDKALTVFNRSLGDARAGTGSLSTFLRRVSPDLQRMLLETKSTGEAVDVMFDALAALPTQQERAALAAAAFGRGGLKMTLAVENGTDALRAAREEVRRYGNVLDERALGQSEAFNDELARAKLAWQGLKSVFGTAFIAAALPELKKLTDWFVANKDHAYDLARGFASDVVNGIGAVAKAVPDIAAALGKVVGAIKDVIEWFGKLKEGARTASIDAAAAVFGEHYVQRRISEGATESQARAELAARVQAAHEAPKREAALVATNANLDVIRARQNVDAVVGELRARSIASGSAPGSAMEAAARAIGDRIAASLGGPRGELLVTIKAPDGVTATATSSTQGVKARTQVNPGRSRGR